MGVAALMSVLGPWVPLPLNESVKRELGIFLLRWLAAMGLEERREMARSLDSVLSDTAGQVLATRCTCTVPVRMQWLVE